MRYLVKKLSCKRLTSVSLTFTNNFRRKMTATRPLYEYVDEVEDLNAYAFGGFHPVNIGDCYQERYRIVHKLGHGSYATTWLARDLRLMRYVALKIGAADMETKEAEVLTALAKGQSRLNSSFPSLLDHFNLDGPNGKHKCLVMEAARCSLAASKEASWVRLFPLTTARILSAQIALAVHRMHSQGYIHNDLHLGNVLLRLPHSFDSLSEEQLYRQFQPPVPQAVEHQDKSPLSPNVPHHVYEAIWMGMPTESVGVQDANTLLSDFGATFNANQESRTQSNTPINIRPPETLFEPGTPISYAADIWSLACMLWEMMAQRPLFGEILATSDIITSQQVNALGVLPKDWWDKWTARSEFFQSDGTPIESRRTPSWDSRFERDIQEPRRKTVDLGGSLDANEAKAFTSMVRSMLSYRPAGRLTAKDVLEAEWMTKYALPELKKAVSAGVLA